MGSVVRDFVFDPNGKKFKFHTEQLSSFDELSEVCRSRKNATSGGFYDLSKNSNYEESFRLLREGCPEKVAPLKTAVKANKANVEGQRKRYQAVQSVCGSAPIVPLALMGVPDSMVSVQQVPIKTKVISLFYDTALVGDRSDSQVLNAGARMIGAMQELEAQGYRFNITVLKAFATSESGCDMLLVKVKDANRPLDLRRLSFPLLHPNFPRVIGWDWYGKFEGATWRSGYGCTLSHSLSQDEIAKAFVQAFGVGSVFLSSEFIIGKNIEAIRDALVLGTKKKV